MTALADISHVTTPSHANLTTIFVRSLLDTVTRGHRAVVVSCEEAALTDAVQSNKAFGGHLREDELIKRGRHTCEALA